MAETTKITLGSKVRIVRDMCWGPRDPSWTAVGVVEEVITGKYGCSDLYFIRWNDGETDHFGLHEIELVP